MCEGLITFVWYSKPIYDPKNLIKKWKKELSKYPNQFRKGKLEYLTAIFNFAKNYEVYLKRKNFIYVSYRTEELKEILIEAIYALNKRYPISKWFFRDIKNLKLKPKNCIKRLEEFSLLGNKEKDLKKKLKILNSLALETYKIAKKEIPNLKVRTEF